VGEAPGRDEDVKGVPFVGRAGGLLDEALESAGSGRDDVFITNLVKCRPPQNRNPKQGEIDACEGMLQDEIRELDPRVVCVLGMVPARWALKDAGVQWKNVSDVVGLNFGLIIGGKERTVIVSYHPAACIYNRKLLPRFRDVMGSAVKASRDVA
jgi:DNA polymerase